MKVITNEEIIANRKKWAGILAPVGLIFLIAGLGTNFLSLQEDGFDETMFYITLACLFIGFITSTMGTSMVHRWVKEPRADQILSKILKGLDNKNLLLNYTTNIPHVLITQNKVFALTIKSQKGKITVNKEKWKREFNLSRVFSYFSEEGLGNPTFEAEHNVKTLLKLLQKHIPNLDVSIEPLIIFTDPKAELSITEPTIPILKGSELKAFIRESLKGTSMGSDVRQKLIEILSPT